MKTNTHKTTTDDNFAITVLRERIELIRAWILKTQMKYDFENIPGLGCMITIEGEAKLIGSEDHKMILKGLSKIDDLKQAIDILTFTTAD